MKKVAIAASAAFSLVVANGANATPTSILKSRGGAACSYEDSGPDTFSLLVESNFPTDDVAVVKKDKWFFLRSDNHNFSKDLIIEERNGKLEVKFSSKIVVKKLRSNHLSRVFTSNGVYTVLVGKSLDSEEANQVAICQYRYTKK